MPEHVKAGNLVELGFTMVEMLVAITILGVLGASVIFAVGGMSDRGQHSACMAEVALIRTAVESYYAQTGTYPELATVATEPAKTEASLNTLTSRIVEIPRQSTDRQQPEHQTRLPVQRGRLLRAPPRGGMPGGLRDRWANTSSVRCGCDKRRKGSTGA